MLLFEKRNFDSIFSTNITSHDFICTVIFLLALFKFPVEVNRNWHYMWSKFYFEKKHSGYIYAFFKTIPYLIRSIFKFVIHYNNYERKKIYYARASGLFNSYLLKKSWYRPNID